MPEWLARRAYLTPDAPALFFGERRWTFSELDAAARRAARRLVAVLGDQGRNDARVGSLVGHGADLEAGSWSDSQSGSQVDSPQMGARVALLLPNSEAFVVWVHAAAKAGVVLVPLNARLTPTEMAWQLADSGAAVLIHDDTYADVARSAVELAATGNVAAIGSVSGTRSLSGTRSVAGTRSVSGTGSVVDTRSGLGPVRLLNVSRGAFDDDDDGDADVGRSRVALPDVHSIVYTSGTTGNPKGAMLTYGNHWWSAAGSVLNLGLVPNDRWLACMPLFHVGGLAILLRSVLYGIPVILHEQFDPDAVNRAIDEQGVSLLSVVAAMLDRMLDARGERPYPPSLRAVLLGGGPAPEALLRRAMNVDMPVLQTYGLTETASQVATLAPEDALRKLGSAGKPLFPTELRIVTEDGGGGPRLASPGEAGEIAVAGPTVTPGYWRRKDASKAKLRDGWLYTGDVGFLDAEGYLYVLDRRDDMFVSGGENVYPAEIEAVLREHPSVAQAAVVGLPDEQWGRVPAAAVVLRPEPTTTQSPDEYSDVETQREGNPSADELQAFCRTRLAGYKVPTRFVFVTALPRNAAGKVMRRRVRETLFETSGARGWSDH